MNKATPKVFSSYAHEDIGMAKKIYNDLKSYNIEIWFDQVSLQPGQNWEYEIEDAIENCSFFIALLSNNSINKKGYVQKESKKALDILDYFPENEIFLIPIRLEECKIISKKISKRQWVDLFPDNKYNEGIYRIAKTINPMLTLLHYKPAQLSIADVYEMIRKHGFYDSDRNPAGRGIFHRYKELYREGKKLVFDETTNLVWQQGGSPEEIQFEAAKEYVAKLNKGKFAGFNDWRLPTLEEAMSLMEPEEKRVDLYIDPKFDRTQKYIWTCDPASGSSDVMWVVDFDFGYCYDYGYSNFNDYVRAVRSGQSSVE